MKRFKELTVVTPNRAGKLGQVLRAVAKAKINLIAMDSSSGYDLNMVRMVTSEPERTRNVLEKLGYKVTEATALGIAVPDKMGALAAVAAAMGRAKLNIDYMYATAGGGQMNALVVVHVSDLTAAEKSLRAAGIAP